MFQKIIFSQFNFIKTRKNVQQKLPSPPIESPSQKISCSQFQFRQDKKKKIQKISICFCLALAGGVCALLVSEHPPRRMHINSKIRKTKLIPFYVMGSHGHHSIYIDS